MRQFQILKKIHVCLAVSLLRGQFENYSILFLVVHFSAHADGGPHSHCLQTQSLIYPLSTLSVCNTTLG